MVAEAAATTMVVVVAPHAARRPHAVMRQPLEPHLGSPHAAQEAVAEAQVFGLPLVKPPYGRITAIA